VRLLRFEEVKKRVKSQFFSRVVADKKTGLVEQMLYMPPQLGAFSSSAASWFMKGQNLVYGTRMEGNRSIMQLRIGKSSKSCIPGFRPIVWKEVGFEGDYVKIVLEGIGGAATTFLPMISSGATKIQIDKYVSEDEKIKSSKRKEVLTCTAYYPMMSKVSIGLDDTDTSTKGDTYLMAIELGQYLESEGLGEYLKEAMCMNFPLNPFKTTNNASSSMVFLTDQSKKKSLIDESIERTKELTVSKDTGVAIFEGVDTPGLIKNYAKRCKAKMVEVYEAEEVAKQAGVRLLNVGDGERGKIGALSSIAFINDSTAAMSPSWKFKMLYRMGTTYVKIKDAFSL